MKTEQITIENLKCGGCANSIQRSIKKIKGTQSVSVDLANSTVTIQHDGANDRILFIQQLSNLGYPETGNSTLSHKAKSYLSCAIGRIRE